MPDRYQQVVTSPVGSEIAKRLGLPMPSHLRRYEPGQPVLAGPALVGGAPEGRLRGPATKLLHAVDADVRSPGDPEAEQGYGALVFDATGITASEALSELYDFFHPVIRQVQPSGRAIVLASPPSSCRDHPEATAQRALEGFVRSLAKELRGGATAQLVAVDESAETGIGSTLRFLLSAKSAYISGQPIRVGPATKATPVDPRDWERPLDGKVALVTGAARGIGEAIASTLARDGADVVCLDIPAQGQALSTVANRLGGTAVQVDITDTEAPTRVAEHLRSRHGGVDIVVHNAGITRDKTLAGMDTARWNAVLHVNLVAQERLNTALLEDDLLRGNGRIVSVSSVSGIAGNRGQTNYATSKAGVIGMVEALAPHLGDRAATINGVAPGFIETEMTAAMPIGAREAGRRMNSLSQGGRPSDVAETVAWLANPASAWVNGQVVRVCGQSIFGA